MGENEKNINKFYQSNIDSSKRYNSKVSTFQISKELHAELKEYLRDKNLTIRQLMEILIKEKLNKG